MKIAIGQINNTVGDFYDNVEMIKNQAIEATAHGAVAIVFPELAVCGYPVRDLHLEGYPNHQTHRQLQYGVEEC